MSTIVVMPGGFHPFHAGHAALYNSARRAFPDAEVFVAATNDTSTRPFPFAVKEKLAKLAGVEPGHFVQVKSPFRAEEITSQFNPDVDSLIFVRSEKDKTKPPQAGGNKKDGSPAYLQPLLSAKRLEPFGKHAYMAYLPTVEFGPGMTSATEIRTAWPTLNEKRKTALVMSLYPATQTNPKLAATVVKLLDTAMGSEQGVAEGIRDPKEIGGANSMRQKLGNLIKQAVQDDKAAYNASPLYQKLWNMYGGDIDAIINERSIFELQKLARELVAVNKQNVAEMDGQNFVGGMTASYQERENQPIDEDYIDEKWSQKYKSSINCANPKGFSQRAHCAGRKK